MGLFKKNKKNTNQKNTKSYDSSYIADGMNLKSDNTGFHKAYIPEFLYKPPFGYPRKDNVVLMRELAKNPYIYSVVKTLCDEAASNSYDIVPKKDIEMTEELEKKRTEILDFFDKPNSNKESFKQIIRMCVKDICEVDAGVLVKAFNSSGKFKEIYARDGGSFLLNPDIYGYLGNREEIIEPANINYAASPSSPDWQSQLNHYTLLYKNTAAYFQYGTTAMALPVPFGLREVIYIKQNPQSNNIYGLSPIQILADVITSLVYGSAYNLDFYMNNNMPEGIISLLGMNKDSLKTFQQRLQKQVKVKDDKTGFWRKIGFKIPVVNREVKFTPIQLDPKVMQIIEQQDWFSRLVWACFGITGDEMGFTDKSNKAVSQSQEKAYKRKAVRPILGLLKYHFDKEIITEFGENLDKFLEFKWEDYDLEEDKKKHDLLEQEIRMNVKTPEMVADELGIDVKKLENSQNKQKENSVNDENAEDDDYKEYKSAESFELGEFVKVTGNSQSHAGEVGKITEIKNNGEEDYYLVTFISGNGIFFKDELKYIGRNIKSAKFDNDLEKKLTKQFKKRSKAIIDAIKKIDKSELDKIE